VNPTFHC